MNLQEPSTDCLSREELIQYLEITKEIIKNQKEIIRKQREIIEVIKLPILN